MQATNLEILSTVLFFLAILHTFLVSKFRLLARHYKPDSVIYQFWHLLSEVEVVFGLWSFIFLGLFAFIYGVDPVITYLDSLDFTEPAFVFVIMCMSATRPVIMLAEKTIMAISQLIPLSRRASFTITTLIVGPLLGSFITEPAAMTVTAMILMETIYKENISLKLKYATIGLLFVNISVGGTLTNFAAPPVLMVARKFHWSSEYMFQSFGLKAMLAITISTLLFAYLFRRELVGPIKIREIKEDHWIPKPWKVIIHVFFMVTVVKYAHHPKVFIALFFLFLGFVMITQKYQDSIKIKESILVGLFLSGLICLGTMQAWWIKIVLAKMNDLALYFGATALTAVTDNAALTYLGSLVDLTDSSKYALVAGAVTGGGLTVIANAPNPAGFAILGESFGNEGIRPLRLFLWALMPTMISIACFLLL